MKKILLLGIALMLTILLTSCIRVNVVSDEIKEYEISSEINSLNIQIGAADFLIERAEVFSVKSNLKYLTVEEKNGLLYIADEPKSNAEYLGAVLTLYVPDGIFFENADITTGAGRVNVDTLNTGTLELSLGAGDVSFGELNVTKKTEIEGGVGRVVISSGTLNDLTLEMGVGNLNLTAALLGKSDLEFGIGKSELTLIGSKNDYTIDIEKGVGSITVEGKSAVQFESGRGKNLIDIEGGIGTIDVVFKEN